MASRGAPRTQPTAAAEQRAVAGAAEKPEAIGATLPFPHSGQVRGAESLRELRPRAGRSRWRAFYRRVGEALVIAAIGPEANVDPQAFQTATAIAERRLADTQLE